MNILVTGGLGFIGHNVVRMLQDQHAVTIIDSKTTYGIMAANYIESLISERLQRINPATTFIGDIRNSQLVRAAFQNADINTVIHLAAFPRAKVVNSDPVTGSEVMINALLNLLLRSKHSGVNRFVYISSSMAYGNFTSGVTEDAAMAPQGAYAIMKLAGEMLVKDFCLQHNIEYVIVRPSAVYGPYDVEDRVVSKFMSAAIRGEVITVKGSDEVLDFTYVDDIAAGIVLAATNPQAANQTYNMTCGQGMTLLDAAKLIVDITSSKSSIVVTDRDLSFPSRGVLSIKKAVTELAYSPTVSIEEGFVKYYVYLKNTLLRT